MTHNLDRYAKELDGRQEQSAVIHELSKRERKEPINSRVTKARCCGECRHIQQDRTKYYDGVQKKVLSFCAHVFKWDIIVDKTDICHRFERKDKK